MAILWMESFDYMGTVNANLSLRGYTGFNLVTITIVQNALNARTGTGFLQFSNSSGQRLIRIADNPLNTCVIGMGFKSTAFPTSDSVNRQGFSFRVGTNDDFVRVVITNSAGLAAYVNGSLVGVSPSNQIILNTWYWLETKVIVGTGTASIEVRVNGATVLTVNGLTIPQITGYGFGSITQTGGSIAHYDDFVVNDTDFLNDRRITTSYVNADTVEADWTPSTGTVGFAMIDEAVPSDADFIVANVAGDVSEFQKQAISLDVNNVAAVCVVARAFKDSAGPSTFRLGMNSAANVINSSEISANTSVAYFNHIFELNPNGNVPWTRAAVDSATVRITRAT